MDVTTSPELCHCGRLATRVHCPNCGSYHVRAFAERHDYETRPDGTVVELKVYRCRGTCGDIFNEDAWQLRCKALPTALGRPVKERAPLNNAPDFVSQGSEEMMRVLEELKRKNKYGE